jgi:hypothetical protein
MFNKSKAWAVGLLVAVAVAGFAAGAVTGSRLVRRGRAPDGYAGFLTRELKLSAAQHDTVTAILRRHRHEMRAVYAQIRPQMDSVRARVSDEIRRALTPAQQQAYQQLLDRDRAERTRADSTAQAQETKP